VGGALVPFPQIDRGGEGRPSDWRLRNQPGVSEGPMAIAILGRPRLGALKARRRRREIREPHGRLWTNLCTTGGYPAHTRSRGYRSLARHAASAKITGLLLQITS
jgi:hypothetical protein